MFWGNTAYCVKLSGEDLSHYSSKIETFDLRKCQYYHCLTTKVMSQQQQTFLKACLTWRENSWQRSLSPCVYAAH